MLFFSCKRKKKLHSLKRHDFKKFTFLGWKFQVAHTVLYIFIFGFIQSFCARALVKGVTTQKFTSKLFLLESFYSEKFYFVQINIIDKIFNLIIKQRLFYSPDVLVVFEPAKVLRTRVPCCFFFHHVCVLLHPPFHPHPNISLHSLSSRKLLFIWGKRDCRVVRWRYIRDDDTSQFVRLREDILRIHNFFCYTPSTLKQMRLIVYIVDLGHIYFIFTKNDVFLHRFLVHIPCSYVLLRAISYIYSLCCFYTS